MADDGRADGVCLTHEELEILRLVDLHGLTQEDAAMVIGISRRTLWRDLHEARRKITEALIYSKPIRIEGCTFEGDTFRQE